MYFRSSPGSNYVPARAFVSRTTRRSRGPHQASNIKVTASEPMPLAAEASCPHPLELDSPFAGFLTSNNRFDATFDTPSHRTIDGVVDGQYTTHAPPEKEAVVAFVRRKGNTYFLVHNVRRQGKVQQLHLARLGERPRITDDVVRKVSRNHPFLDLDWSRSARAGEQPGRAVRHPVAVCAKPDALITQP